MLGKETKNMFTNFFILSKTVESVNEGVLSCNLYKQIIISFRLSLKDLQQGTSLEETKEAWKLFELVSSINHHLRSSLEF